MYLVKEMPKNERPRERLIEYGVSSLSNEELLAILLRTGMHDFSVLDLSKNVLYHLESLEDLKRMTVEELLTIKGIKEAKACTIIAAIELGKRLSKYSIERKKVISSPIDVYYLLSGELSHLLQEHFICLYLNTKSEILKKETIFIGTINQTLIHPREIFKTGIKLSASAVLFVHNHPTGDSTPSKADKEATYLLMEGSRFIGIDFIDHIVIGKNEYYSIKEQKKTRLGV
ncbi:MAG: DNA repair protein RadC [Acholeplasmataceae bacterium]|nr:DNA repair protein RadC [Acholeplasmataceae bacterium]